MSSINETLSARNRHLAWHSFRALFVVGAGICAGIGVNAWVGMAVFLGLCVLADRSQVPE
jgi:hypothetical protein